MRQKIGRQVGFAPLLGRVGGLAISVQLCEKQLRRAAIYSSSQLSTGTFASPVENFRDLKTKKAENSGGIRLKDKLLVAFHVRK